VSYTVSGNSQTIWIELKKIDSEKSQTVSRSQIHVARMLSIIQVAKGVALFFLVKNSFSILKRIIQLPEPARAGSVGPRAATPNAKLSAGFSY
jgi:hypothetical protein